MKVDASGRVSFGTQFKGDGSYLSYLVIHNLSKLICEFQIIRVVAKHPSILPRYFKGRCLYLTLFLHVYSKSILKVGNLPKFLLPINNEF